MKQIIQSLFVLLFLLPVLSYSQPGFKKGSVVTAGSGRIEGSIRESLTSKGTIQFLSSERGKATYAASDLLSFTIESVNYLAWSNDFYQELSSGPKASLYQKVTDNSHTPLYNGPDVVGFSKTTEGKKGNIYIFLHTVNQMNLVTRKTFEENIAKLFSGRIDLQTAIKNKTFTFSELAEAMQLYNSLPATENTSASAINNP